ncbi:MAG TPA: hypothetical protein VGB52_06500 [Actinomycetota bacterium]
MERILVLLSCLALGLSACTGDGTGASSPATVAGARTAKASASPVAREGAPLARLQVGTDSAEGTLIRLCDGDRCELAAASPERTMKLADDELLLFVVSEAPQRARVEIRRDGETELTERGAMEPGTLMGFPTRLARGRYEVRLIARWGERRAVWRFSLAVPGGEP